MHNCTWWWRHALSAEVIQLATQPTRLPRNNWCCFPLHLIPPRSNICPVLPPHLPPIHICPADIGAVADGWKVGVFQIPFGDNTSVERLFWANKFQHDPWDISICQHHHHHHGHDHPRPRPPIQASSAAVPCEGHLPSQLLNATFHRHHHYHN